MPVADDVLDGHNVRKFQPSLSHLYGCGVGDETRTGAIVEIQNNNTIGCRRKVLFHTSVGEGVTIEDKDFIGHEVMFAKGFLATSTLGAPSARISVLFQRLGRIGSQPLMCQELSVSIIEARASVKKGRQGW